MYGLRVGDLGPAKKPTRVMSNSPPLLAHCQRRCSKKHEHVPLLGGARTHAAESFPPELVSSLASGVEDGALAFHRQRSRAREVGSGTLFAE
eukprot:8856915-Pyramimonas_sp.AAC.1